MPETAGLEDFLRWLDQEPPTFTLLAVKAPLGHVTGLLADGRGPDQVLEQAKVRQAEPTAAAAAEESGGDGEGTVAEAQDEAEDQWLAVVRLRDDPWTFVYCPGDPSVTSAAPTVVVGESGDETDPSGVLESEAQDLSESLGTDALILRAWPAADGGPQPEIRYQVYADGDLAELAEWRSGEALRRFESSLREQPELEAPGFGLLDRTLKDRGIYVPSCRVSARSSGAILTVSGIDPSRIERADLLCLPAEMAWPEDETLDLRLRAVTPVGDGEAVAAPGPAPDTEAMDASSAVAEETASEARAGEDRQSAEVPSDDPSKLRGFFSRLFGRAR